MHKRVISKKQNSTQKEWLYAWNNIEKIVSKEHILAITYKTVEELIRSTAGKKVAYAWSGGKDAIVLAEICRLAGIEDRLLIKTRLEYYDMESYFEKHMTEKTIVQYTIHDLEWLSKNQDHLFPVEYKYVDAYMKHVRNEMEKYFFDNNLDQLIIGLRIADGNFVPKKITTNKNGYTRNSPLSDWTHEEVLGFIYYNNLELPKIYSYEDGFKQGTGPYFKMMRKNKTINDMWRYVYKHDKKRVHEASQYIESARLFLEGIQNENRKDV